MWCHDRKVGVSPRTAENAQRLGHNAQRLVVTRPRVAAYTSATARGEWGGKKRAAAGSGLARETSRRTSGSHGEDCQQQTRCGVVAGQQPSRPMISGTAQDIWRSGGEPRALQDRTAGRMLWSRQKYTALLVPESTTFMITIEDASFIAVIIGSVGTTPFGHACTNKCHVTTCSCTGRIRHVFHCQRGQVISHMIPGRNHGAPIGPTDCHPRGYLATYLAISRARSAIVLAALITATREI